MPLTKPRVHSEHLSVSEQRLVQIISLSRSSTCLHCLRDVRLTLLQQLVPPQHPPTPLMAATNGAFISPVPALPSTHLPHSAGAQIMLQNGYTSAVAPSAVNPNAGEKAPRSDLPGFNVYVMSSGMPD